MASFNAKISPFPIPTGVILEIPSSGKRQDGMRPAVELKLADLDEATLVELCDEFTKNVFKAAGREL